MHRYLKDPICSSNIGYENGSAIFIVPVLILIVFYMLGFFIDLGDAFTKSDAIDQSLSLAVASATTQVSRANFYLSGKVILDPDAATSVALNRLYSSLPKSIMVVGSPSIKISGGGICMKATSTINLPFELMPNKKTIINYTSSSSAIARGSISTTPPQC